MGTKVRATPAVVDDTAVVAGLGGRIAALRLTAGSVRTLRLAP